MIILKARFSTKLQFSLRVAVTCLFFLTAGLLHAGEGDEQAVPCDITRGEKIYQKCAICHSLDNRGEHLAGPNLHKILGRPVGKIQGFKFSRKLRKSEDIWTAELMDVFLESPLMVYPGIRMAFAGLKKEKDRADLICYLKEHAGGD